MTSIFKRVKQIDTDLKGVLTSFQYGVVTHAISLTTAGLMKVLYALQGGEVTYSLLMLYLTLVTLKFATLLSYSFNPLALIRGYNAISFGVYRLILSTLLFFATFIFLHYTDNLPNTLILAITFTHLSNAYLLINELRKRP